MSAPKDNGRAFADKVIKGGAPTQFRFKVRGKVRGGNELAVVIAFAGRRPLAWVVLCIAAGTIAGNALVLL